MYKFQSKLQKYVRQLIHLGVNLMPGETLLISADVEKVPLVRLCAAEG